MTELSIQEQSNNEEKTLVIFDGHALIYRAYHAFPGLTKTDGTLVNAVYGFARILLTSLRDFEPECVAVAFDHPDKTQRHQEYEEYKANREEMPDDLKPQIEIVESFVQAMNIPLFKVSGFEADDIIGTITAQVEEEQPDYKSIVITGDKDLLQLATDETHIFIPKRGKYGKDLIYSPELVHKKLGVRPDQVTEYKALMGDSSDNIPGVKGVGKKTGLRLLQTYGSLDAIFEVIDKLASGEITVEQLPEDQQAVLKPSVVKNLTRDKEQCYLSLKLATINREAPISFAFGDCKINDYDKQQVVDLLDSLQFESLKKLLPLDSFESGIQDALF